MCDCVSKINEQLPGDDEIDMTVNLKEGYSRPRIPTKEGRFVEPTYCPYCGEKYNSD